MSIQPQPSRALLQALVEIARELPPSTLASLATALSSDTGGASLERYAATPSTKRQLRQLAALIEQAGSLDTPGVGLALQAAAAAIETVTTDLATEIVWTGPSTTSVPLRRVDQVMYDLLSEASQEVLLVTYAAYKADYALAGLRAATERGVRVRLLIELAEESGGKIKSDGLNSFRVAVPAAEVYYWPLDRRTKKSAGGYGAMHVKCLVVDRRRSIVSSANLTDHALELNMELGLLGSSAVSTRLADHFDQLINRGEFQRVTQVA